MTSMSMTPGSKIIMAEYDMTTIQIGPINMWQVNVTRGICPYIVCCYFEPWSIYQKVGKILYNWFTFTLICQEDFEKEEKIPKKKILSSQIWIKNKLPGKHNRNHTLLGVIWGIPCVVSCKHSLTLKRIFWKKSI